jgi:hypothetical protein
LFACAFVRFESGPLNTRSDSVVASGAWSERSSAATVRKATRTGVSSPDRERECRGQARSSLPLRKSRCPFHYTCRASHRSVVTSRCAVRRPLRHSILEAGDRLCSLRPREMRAFIRLSWYNSPYKVVANRKIDRRAGRSAEAARDFPSRRNRWAVLICRQPPAVTGWLILKVVSRDHL